MAKLTNLREEAIQLFDTGDSRSFNEIYSGREDLFENVDDMIDPRFRRLFESVYDKNGKPKSQRHLKESMAGAEVFLELLEDKDTCEQLRQSLLKEVPLKVKKEIKNGLSEGSIEDMLKAVSAHFGIEDQSDIASLSDKESKEMMGSIMGICAVADRMDMIADMIRAAAKLNEGLFRSTKTPIPRSKYVDNAQNRKLGRVGDEYGDQEYETEPGIIPGAIANFFGGVGGTILKIVGLIALGLAPLAGLIHNICRMAITDYGGGPGTAANIAGIVIFGLMCMPSLRTTKRTRESRETPIYRCEKCNGPLSREDANFGGGLCRYCKEELEESEVRYGSDLWGNSELNNKNDGVPGGHNRGPDPGGQDKMTVQSGSDYDTNPKLFESIYRLTEGEGRPVPVEEFEIFSDWLADHGIQSRPSQQGHLNFEINGRKFQWSKRGHFRSQSHNKNFDGGYQWYIVFKDSTPPRGRFDDSRQAEAFDDAATLIARIEKARLLDKEYVPPTRGGLRFKENEERGTPSTTANRYNFSGSEKGPSNDGVPAGHNRAGMSGSDGQTTQSRPGYHTNAKLGHEPAMGDSTKIHERFEGIFKKSLKEGQYKKFTKSDLQIGTKFEVQYGTIYKVMDLEEDEPNLFMGTVLKIGKRDPDREDLSIGDPGTCRLGDIRRILSDKEYNALNDNNYYNEDSGEPWDDDFDYKDIADLVYESVELNDMSEEETIQFVLKVYPFAEEYLEKYGSPYGFSLSEMYDRHVEDKEEMSRFDNDDWDDDDDE